jgi:hypothetical protein
MHWKPQDAGVAVRATLAGAVVRPPRSERAVAHTFRLQLATPDTQGRSKYILAAPSAPELTEWTRVLQGAAAAVTGDRAHVMTEDALAGRPGWQPRESGLLRGCWAPYSDDVIARLETGVLDPRQGKVQFEIQRRGHYEVDLTQPPTSKDSQGRLAYLQVSTADHSRQRMVRRRLIGSVPPPVPEWEPVDAPEDQHVHSTEDTTSELQQQTLDVLKSEAERRGIKKSGVGWQTCCPPSGNKSDIIKALLQMDIQEVATEDTATPRKIQAVASPRSAFRKTRTLISGAWVNPDDPNLRGSFPCEARVLRQVKLRREPKMKSKKSGYQLQELDIVIVLREEFDGDVGFYEVQKKLSAAEASTDTQAGIKGWIKQVSEGAWYGGQGSANLSLYTA